MKKPLVISLFAVFLLAGCAAAPAEDTENGVTHISMEEAQAMMEQDENCIILDVRSYAEYAERHIPGAICIPNDTIGKEEIAQLPDKDQRIMVYCRSGRRSKQAAAKLALLGYTDIVEIGGINDWPGETVSGEEP